MVGRLSVWVAVLSGACSAAAGDPDARRLDANVPATCEGLLAEWEALVDAAQACVPGDPCQVVDATPRCDDGTVWGTCGWAVNPTLFDTDRADALTAQSSAMACGHNQIVDCGVGPTAECVNGRCAIVDEVSCWPIPDDLRGGTVGFAHETMVNDLTALGIAAMDGARVWVWFDDLATGLAPVFGNRALALGECNVFVYANPADEVVQVDEGDVRIDGVPPCAFDASIGRYACYARTPGTAAAAVTADFDPTTTLTTLTVAGETFTADAIAIAGMHITVDGLAHAAYGGPLPIVSVVSDDQVVVYSARAAACYASAACTEGELDEVAVNATYAIEAGAGPIPGGFAWLDAVTPIGVTKADGAVVPGFTTLIVPSGQGLTMAVDSARLDAMPATADADVVVGCGDCGNSGGLIVEWDVEVVTTDADLSGALPWEMPDAVAQWATLTCRGSLGAQEIVIPTAAWAAVLSAGPTRIETRAFRVTADRSSDATGATAVVGGHGVVGYTDL